LTSVGGSASRSRYLRALIVAAIVVVASAAVIIGVSMINGPKKVSVAISPEHIPNVPAGRSQALTAEVAQGDSLITNEVDLQWSIEPESLGTVVYETKPETVFEAGNEAGYGLVKLRVSHEGKTYSVEAKITVGPPVLESVSVSPPSKLLLVDEECTFTASVMDSVGALVQDATIEWSVLGAEPGEFTVNTTIGRCIAFSASVPANVTLAVGAEVGDESVSESATVVVVEPTLIRTIDYRWYDMFAHPIGEWVIARESWSSAIEHTDYTDSYPYLYKPGGYLLNDETWSFMRLEMVGRGMTELCMNENPVFLPYLSGEEGERGGSASIDIYMNYLNEEQYYAFNPGTMMPYDGAMMFFNWTVVLDEQAAKSVLGITGSQFDDFDSWWETNQASVRAEWIAWLDYEGNERLDIFNAYEFYFETIQFTIDAEKIDDQVALDVDSISWGMEVLMARWMNHAWAPTEWIMEDMSLTAAIGPESAEVYLDAAVGNSLYACDPGTEGNPCWVWKPRMLDCIVSTYRFPKSLFDPYYQFEYNCTASGSDLWYGEMMPYDYTPGAWNLTAGETMTFEWPEGEQLFLLHDADGTGDGTFENTADLYATMAVGRLEPSSKDAPDVVTVNLGERRITFEGPFDMWNWSMGQSEHEFLADEWDRLGILPYGIPYIEFSADLNLNALDGYHSESESEDRGDARTALYYDGFAIAVIVTAAYIFYASKKGPFRRE